MRLVRSIVLAREHQCSDPLATWRAGSVLWRERSTTATTIELESPADWLDLDTVDFADVDSIESDAAWVFEVDFDDPYRPARGALRLRANNAHPAVDVLLRSEPSDNQRLIESALRWDIGRTLIDNALRQPRFVEDFGDFSPDTVGGVAQRLLELHVPDVAIDALATIREPSTPPARGAVAGPVADVEITMTEPLDGLGFVPLTDDERVALFRRRDLVANPVVARAIAQAVLRSGLSAAPRLALIERVALELLRLTPMIELDALAPDDLDRLISRITVAAASRLRPIASPDGRPPT